MRRFAWRVHPSFYAGQPRILAVVPFAHDEEAAQRVKDKKPHLPTRLAVEAKAAPHSAGLSRKTEERFARLRKRLGTTEPAIPTPDTAPATHDEATNARLERFRAKRQRKDTSPPNSQQQQRQPQS